MSTTPASTLDRPPTGAEPEGDRPAGRRRTRPRSKKRRVVRIALYVLAVVLLLAGGIGYWALDEYIIDHVEIADVDAYEAETGTRVEAAEVTADPDAEVTATTYTSDTTSITISTVVTGSGDDQVTYYVADVVVDDATLIRGGFAEDKFGENIIEDTSDIAEDNDAVFAINGDYYGYRSSGIVIRNGVLYRDDGARTGLAMYADGTMAIYDETTTTGDELLDAGVWNTVSFGPALVEDGEIVDGIEDVEVDTNFGNHSIQGNQPRTAIGIVDTNHYVFVAVDGRATGYSRGVTMTELAQIFVDLGATTAYNLDGGGSTTMVFDGELVNDPLGKGDERGTSDILYVAG
ncbi:MAG: phosphodiester glycosidase family protein [Actinobacteria bacterium]|nr:phosphodiester glycosidase family protein [Actinomycetota bacterium]